MKVPAKLILRIAGTSLIQVLVLPFILSMNLIAQSGFPYREIGPGDIKTGAERTGVYFPQLQGRNIALVANQTSMIGDIHLTDSLLRAGFNILKVFCPEHGFRGEAGAGDLVSDGRDTKTGLPIISLYGSRKKPNTADLKGIDMVVFDMQDVGIRFYTYISTMTYVMEACAEQGIPFLLLDRPNPNGHFIDGPVLDTAFRSFVGMHPIPVVHGMTLGEYAAMVNGEGWLKNGIKCDVKIVRISGYTHKDMYQLPIRPSPNLPNMASVYLYPSLAFFEGTDVSVGRGTDIPFQVFGHPDLKGAPFQFIPEKRPGAAPNPPQEGVVCNGYDLREFGDRFIRNFRNLYLFWVIETYRDLGGDPSFFTPFFDKLAGTDVLRNQIISGFNEQQIRESWEADLAKYRQIRKKYLLYPDFE